MSPDSPFSRNISTNLPNGKWDLVSRCLTHALSLSLSLSLNECAYVPFIVMTLMFNSAVIHG